MNTQKIIHDIRNPLNAIVMNAELGKLSVQRSVDPNKLIAIFDVILKECRACSEQLTLLKEGLNKDEPELGLHKELFQTEFIRKHE